LISLLTLQSVLPMLAAVSSLALAALALAGRPPLPVQRAFALGMLGFAAESVLALMLLTVGGVNGHVVAWTRALHIASLAALLAWGVFVAVLAGLQMRQLPASWRLGRGVCVALAVGSMAAIMVWPGFTVNSPGWPAAAVVLQPPARIAAVVQVLLTVAILAGLESCLRTARDENRRRVKYLVLGIGGVFLLRFYVLSQVLLFNALFATQVKMTCAAVFIGNLVLAVPIARDQLRGARLSVSRQMLYRSTVVGILGIYLFAVAVVSSLLTYLAIPEETFWASMVVFVSALGLAALLLSDRLRWRLQRFIALHFYRSKYDYRHQWVAFTKRLGSLLTAEEIGPALAQAVTQAVGTLTGAVYLETDDARYRLRGTAGPAAFASVLEANHPLANHLRAADGPLPLSAELLASVNGASSADSAVAVPLRWRTGLLGFIVLGPQRDGREYGIEDFEFLTTIAEQAGGSIATARLSEAVAHAREMETFDRLSAAVIHDIKNAVSALALLSRNAASNLDDPEFQRDTITTLVRTVDRMKRLLGRLSSPVDAMLRADQVDLHAVVREAVVPLSGHERIHLVCDVHPVGEIAGDRDALLRVVENLLTNAMESIEGRGIITVRLAEQSGAAVLTITDTGCGMSEEFRQRFLFSPFRSTKKAGWGIGLYQTKQVIERHYGEISVESVEGHGTTFTVTLPIGDPSEPPASGDTRDTHAWERVR
jgi:putative PEP-CTERM system histidine kinase